jgi:N-formylmaleamate deformylase
VTSSKNRRGLVTEEWQTGFVEVNGIRLYYTRTGGDKPPLVLAHGVTDAGPCWSPVAEALAAEYDVIMVDARGHGHSDAPDIGYGPAEQADDLAGVIRILGPDHPAVLGHSMGAATALVLAGAYRDLPGAILLEDPPAWWIDRIDSPGEPERRARMKQRAIGLKQKTRDESIAGQRAEQPGWSDAELEPWADAKQQFSPNVLSVYDQDNAENVDWPAVLSRIACPALLITGDPERGAIVTDENAMALKALVPHLEIAHVPGAGHNIRRDRFAPYMEIAHGFLSAYHEHSTDRGRNAAHSMGAN